MHSMRWDTGEPITGTPFRQLIPADATDSAFSCHSALIQPHRLVVPHTHTNDINTRYGHIPHAELIPELTRHYAVVP